MDIETQIDKQLAQTRGCITPDEIEQARKYRLLRAPIVINVIRSHYGWSGSSTLTNPEVKPQGRPAFDDYTQRD